MDMLTHSAVNCEYNSFQQKRIVNTVGPNSCQETGGFHVNMWFFSYAVSSHIHVGAQVLS